MHTHSTLASCAVALVAIVPASTRRPATVSTYTDAAGDGSSAPDIRSVTLTDGGDGSVAVEIALAADIPDDGSIVVFAVVADRNEATGDPDGAEYAVIMTAAGAALAKWDGAWVASSNSGLSPQMRNGRLSFILTIADLGNPASFGFWVGSVHGTDVDVAPDTGAFTYPQAVVERP